MSAVRKCSHYLPPVSLSPVANLPPMLLKRWQIATRVIDTGKSVSFAAGINDTSGIGGKFAIGVVDIGGVL
jgi:hypothetical protein